MRPLKELQAHLKALNPQPDDQLMLIYGSEYELYRDGKHIGSAAWTQDDNVGDSFQVQEVDESGLIISKVFIADKWELKVK